MDRKKRNNNAPVNRRSGSSRAFFLSLEQIRTCEMSEQVLFALYNCSTENRSERPLRFSTDIAILHNYFFLVLTRSPSLWLLLRQKEKRVSQSPHRKHQGGVARAFLCGKPTVMNSEVTKISNVRCFCAFAVWTHTGVRFAEARAINTPPPQHTHVGHCVGTVLTEQSYYTQQGTLLCENNTHTHHSHQKSVTGCHVFGVKLLLSSPTYECMCQQTHHHPI